MSDTALFKVVGGNPTDHDIAALSAVFAQLMASGDTERNLWGHPDKSLFNPSAFRNLQFY